MQRPIAPSSPLSGKLTHRRINASRWSKPRFSGNEEMLNISELLHAERFELLLVIESLPAKSVCLRGNPLGKEESRLTDLNR